MWPFLLRSLQVPAGRIFTGPLCPLQSPPSVLQDPGIMVGTVIPSVHFLPPHHMQDLLPPLPFGDEDMGILRNRFYTYRNLLFDLIFASLACMKWILLTWICWRHVLGLEAAIPHLSVVNIWGVFLAWIPCRGNMWEEHRCAVESPVFEFGSMSCVATDLCVLSLSCPLRFILRSVSLTELAEPGNMSRIKLESCA